MDSVESNARELTYGEKAVGLTFNPGKHEAVENIKQNAAKLIDDIYDKYVKPGPVMANGEVIAQAIIAIRRIQEGQMRAVKAATWQY